MSDKYTLLASHMEIYATKSHAFKKKYSSLLNKSDKKLVSQIMDDYKKMSLQISPESFAYYSNFIFTSEDKKKNGIEYTPELIAKNMSSYAISRVKNKQHSTINIIDPAIGSGMMVLSMIRIIYENSKINVLKFIENNIFGIDNDDFQILLSEISLSLLSLEMTGKIPNKINLLNYNSFYLSKDFLLDKFGVGEFDIVITNPPYIRSRNLDSNTKALIKENFKETSVGIIDTYIPFFQIAMNILCKRGVGILITPNSYFTTNNGKALRQYLLKNSSEIRLINFDEKKLFDGVMTYSAITCFLKNEKTTSNTNIKSIILDSYNLHNNFDNLITQDVQLQDTWRILDKNDQNIIKKLECNYPTKLENLNFKNGIATQRNNIYSFVFNKEDDEYYYFKDSEKNIKVEKKITKKFIMPNQKRKIDNQRIIFPYYYNDLDKKSYIIPEEQMKKKYPCTYEYLISYYDDLKTRAVDKNIPIWYAYGRSQGLNDRGLRLYLPYIASKVHTSLSTEIDEVFAAGYAIYNDNNEYLSFLSKILSSDIFAYYISMVSKPYSQGYYSTAKSQVKNFSVPSEWEYESSIKNNWNKNIYELYSLSTSEIKRISNSLEKR